MVDDDTRDRLVKHVMRRDGLIVDGERRPMPESIAKQIVNRLAPHDLVRLEMEARDHDQPTFAAEYNPYG